MIELLADKPVLNFPRLRAAVSLALSSLLVTVAGCGLLGSDDKIAAPTELTDITAQVEFRELWAIRAGSGNGDKYMRLSPAVIGDLLVVTDADGRVQAVERSSGEQRWSTELDARISGGVGAGQGLVVLGSHDGSVYVLEADTGVLRWEARVSSEVLTSAVMTGDKVIVQSMDDNIHAFSAETGESLWVFDNEVPILTLRGTSQPLVRDDLLVAGFANGKVAGIDLQNGQLRWEYRVGIPSGESELERMVDIDGDLLLADDTVYAASYQGRVSAVHVTTGVSRWDRNASTYQGLSLGEQNLYMADQDGVVEALNRRTSDPVWKQEGLKHRRLTAPVTLGERVVVGDYQGYLHVLSPQDGAFIGRTKLHSSGIRSRMLVADNVLYVMANSGHLAAYQIN